MRKQHRFSEDIKLELDGISDGVLMHTLHQPGLEKPELRAKILWMNLLTERSESHGSIIGEHYLPFEWTLMMLDLRYLGR